MENKKRKSVIITKELIIDIISRVQVKDLMRFTCVSKALCSFSYFNRLQMECTDSLDHRQFVLIEKLVEPAYRSVSYHYHLIDLESIEDETINLNLREIPHPFLVASCQGLLVHQQWFSHKMAVSNPLTRRHLIVPANPAGDAHVAFCGFGYDRAHDCYKLIFETKQALDRTFDLMVYDINNDMWCRYEWKDWPPYSFLQCWSMKCVDGVQYWCLELNIDSESREISKVICFVLADFGEVKYYPNMYVLDGRLCLMVLGLENDTRDVWMMDIECFLMIPIKTRILFDVGQTLFWYDQVNHQFYKLNDDPVNTNSAYCTVMSYTPGLVGIGIF